VPGDPPVDLGEDGELGVVDLAVDVDGDQFLRGLLDLGKDLLDARRLPRTGEAPADGVLGPDTPQTRPDLEREFPDLGVTMIELLGDIIDLEDFGVPKQRLVPHEQVLLHYTLLGVS
jgi:hypothetical protein